MLPYYHMISDEEVEHVKHLYQYKTIREFEEDMDFLLKNYSPIGLLEFLHIIKAGRPLPNKVFLLTFDDGFREMHDIVAPILLKKGISATFFVNSAFTDNKQLCYHNKASILAEHFLKKRTSSLEKKVFEVLQNYEFLIDDMVTGILSISYRKRDLLDKIAPLLSVDFDEYLKVKKPYLTSNNIERLIENGFTIGAHSIDHPRYDSISLEDQICQTLESLKFVREKYQLNYGVFAFPHSDNNVSREFFDRLYTSEKIDLSFGTAGPMNDSVSNNFQRISLEKPVVAAKNIVAYQHVRKLIKSVTGKDTIQRH